MSNSKPSGQVIFEFAHVGFVPVVPVVVVPFVSVVVVPFVPVVPLVS